MPPTKADAVGKAIQCPSCGRKHGVSGLPDAPTFKCEGCGQPLKVPSQFRPSVMASSRHVRPPDAPHPESTSVLPSRPAPAAAAAPVAASASKAARPAEAPGPAAGVVPPTDTIALPLRVLAWVVALALGLVVTIWVARVTGWLSGDRLVDVFVGTGITRYIRVIAVAPVWALFTTILLTLFLEGGRALARRRAEKRAAANDSLSAQRGESEPFEEDDWDRAGDHGEADEPRSRRAAAPRGGP
ncbi:MAG TPA: hypothetical protein VG348_15645 [Acidimicrobiia bacterium]|nr:hypothetical protein [Acidimicrobiia bacterium]